MRRVSALLVVAATMLGGCGSDGAPRSEAVAILTRTGDPTDSFGIEERLTEAGFEVVSSGSYANSMAANGSHVIGRTYEDGVLVERVTRALGLPLRVRRFARGPWGGDPEARVMVVIGKDYELPGSG